jgi:hypothetical protein
LQRYVLGQALILRLTGYVLDMGLARQSAFSFTVMERGKMQPWKSTSTPEKIDVVSPEGAVRCSVTGYYGGNIFIIDDMKADVRPGDEIRRSLPNGNEEVFTVEDPKFFRAGPFGDHYQV